METVLRALADPTRLAILRLVRDRERTAGQIAERFPVTPSAISQHLAVLAGAGLLARRREGTRRLYRARPEGLRELRAFLEGFWDQGLDALKRAVEAEARRDRRRG